MFHKRLQIVLNTLIDLDTPWMAFWICSGSLQKTSPKTFAQRTNGFKTLKNMVNKVSIAISKRFQNKTKQKI